MKHLSIIILYMWLRYLPLLVVWACPTIHIHVCVHMAGDPRVDPEHTDFSRGSLTQFPCVLDHGLNLHQNIPLIQYQITQKFYHIMLSSSCS